MFRTVRLQLDLAKIAITGVLAEINALTLETSVPCTERHMIAIARGGSKLLGQAKGLFGDSRRLSF